MLLFSVTLIVISFVQRSLSLSFPAVYAQQASKVWLAQSCYAWKMQVYTGKPTSEGPEKNQGMRVVLDVTDELRGHNVT